MKKILVALIVVMLLVGCAPDTDEYGNEMEKQSVFYTQEGIDTPSELLLLKAEGYGDWIIRRFIDEELGIVCYADGGTGMACLYLKTED